MIFNEYPWLNESWREGEDKNCPESLAYNESIYNLTARWAILEWAKGKHAAIWDDVIDYHFRHDGEEILKTVIGWGETTFLTAVDLDVALAKYRSKGKTNTLSTPVSSASNRLTNRARPSPSPFQEALLTDFFTESALLELFQQ